MSVGAQDVGQHEGIARIAFATGGAVARPVGLDDVRMDRNHGIPGLDQGIDDQTGWSLDGDGQFGRRRHALEPGYHVGQSSRIVADIETDDDLADVVNNAQGMACTAPVQACVKYIC